jgi:RNA polymerase sigma factor (sigma-70 family)
MAANQLTHVIQSLREATLHYDEAGLTDGQLLETYVRSQEEAAFAALVHRHGPMVWGICRRVLRIHQDAEDAFQATFLVLVRKAASIASKELVANWLYGVAHQTALKANATTAKRGAREKQVTTMPEPVLEPEHADDVQPLLDQELSCLPDKYRAVIVLCELEGKTRKEAARQLKLPEGTVASRLATARTMLAKRLVRRGVVLPAGGLAAVLAQNLACGSVPIAMALNTIKAATSIAAGQAAAGVISTSVAALMEGVLNAMLIKKIKTTFAVLIVLAFVLPVMGVLMQAAISADPAEKVKDGIHLTKEGPKNRKEGQPAADDPVTSKKGPEAPMITDLDNIRGAWKVVSAKETAAFEDNIDVPEYQGSVWIFDKKDITIQRAKAQTRLAFSLDPSKAPKEFNFGPDLNGKNEKRPFLGIYELAPDKLKLCYTVFNVRPTTFSMAKGISTITRLVILERQKPEPRRALGVKVEADGATAKLTVAFNYTGKTGDAPTFSGVRLYRYDLTVNGGPIRVGMEVKGNRQTVVLRGQSYTYIPTSANRQENGTLAVAKDTAGKMRLTGVYYYEGVLFVVDEEIRSGDALLLESSGRQVE